eukprot:m.94472 g.94472  ORF g.94472 m.94472 type:complete len:235 (+) comp13445_c0_seq6:212-916(+)
MTNKITFLVILILLPQISSLSQCDGTDADCNEPRNDRYSENKEEPNNKFQTAWRRLKKLSSEGFDFLQKKADVAHKGLHDASKLIQEHGMPVVKNIVDKVSTGGSEAYSKIQEHGMPIVKNIVDKVSTGGSEAYAKIQDWISKHVQHGKQNSEEPKRSCPFKTVEDIKTKFSKLSRTVLASESCEDMEVALVTFWSAFEPHMSVCEDLFLLLDEFNGELTELRTQLCSMTNTHL